LLGGALSKLGDDESGTANLPYRTSSICAATEPCALHPLPHWRLLAAIISALSDKEQRQRLKLTHDR